MRRRRHERTFTSMVGAKLVVGALQNFLWTLASRVDWAVLAFVPPASLGHPLTMLHDAPTRAITYRYALWCPGRTMSFSESDWPRA